MPSILTNMASLTAQRHLGMTQSAFNKSVERLSSGLRINSAADDAAGLFISERLKAQVGGLQQATRNAQDGTSLLQTADGGLSVHHDILLRLRELAVQSANGVMTNTDRQLSITPEAKALLDELTRVAQSTQFNGLKLLDGTLGGTQVTGAGTAVGSNAALMLPDGTTVVKAAAATPASGADLTAANGILNIQAGNGVTQPAQPTGYTLSVGTAYAAATDDITLTLTQEGGATQSVYISGVSNISGARMVKFDQFGIDLTVDSKLATNTITTNGGFAVSQNTKLLDTNSTTATGPTTIDSTSVLPPGVNGLVLQVGANNVSADRMTLLNMNSMTAEALGLEKGANSGSTWDLSTSLSTQSGAQDAIAIIDNAINQVSSLRSNIGAAQNRLDYTVTNLGVAAENQQAAASRITDANVAAEVSNMVKTQILSQSAMAILAQANAAPQALLSLFR